MSSDLFQKRYGQGRMRPFRLAAALLCAVSIWAGFPNDLVELPVAILLWPLCVAWLGATADSPKQALFLGWLPAWIGSCAAQYWLSFPVHDVGGLNWAASLLCGFFICACLSTQSALYSVIGFITAQYSTWRKVTVLGFSWYLLEYFYAIALGFPWLPISGALAAWPVTIQLADITGAYFLGALWVMAILFLFPRVGIAPVSSRCAASSIISGISLSLAIVGYGAWRLADIPLESWPEGEGSLDAIFVEGNVEQNQKWIPAFQRSTLELYLGLTASGMATARARGIEHPLIIWPETALPFFFETRPVLAEAVRDCARKYGCPLLFGAPGVERLPDVPEGAVFNRAFLLAPDGRTLGHYDKEHLVPFGEYLPPWLNWPFLEALLQGVGIYREGTATAPLRYGPLALGMLICYEGIFPWLAQQRVEQGANILVDISNDGWFGRSPAARQHLYLTIPRCLEQNRWLLRATNTGISAVVDARGRIVIAGRQFQAGALLAAAKVLNTPSFYHKIASWLPAGAIILILMLLFLPGKDRASIFRKTCRDEFPPSFE